MSEYFGYRASNTDQCIEPRSDFAKIVSEDCEILEINTQIYQEILQKTSLSTKEKKLEFLN